MNREVEIEDSGITRSCEKRIKRFRVKFYDFTREVGGLVLGWWDGTDYRIKHLLQLKNRSKEPQTSYKLPGALVITLKVLPYLFMGWVPIGEFHSHLNGKVELSESDMQAIDKRLKRAKFYVVAIIRWKKKAKVYVFKKNLTTNQGAVPRLRRNSGGQARKERR